MRHFGNPGRVEPAVYAKLHANRHEHIELARRAREYQAQLSEAEAQEARKVAWLCLGVAIGAMLAVLGLGYHSY